MIPDDNANNRTHESYPAWEDRALTGCLFASGFAALAFEVVWTRLLLYSYGNTVPAMTTVVTAVMAGLGLGGLAGGRLADRSRNPAKLYGTLELCLAATALATPFVLSVVRSLYLHLSPSISDSGGAMGIFLRYGLTLGALVVPSLLMGATLPVAGLAFRRAGHAAGKAAGRAYGWNTLGAAVGTFAAGYFLLPTVGIGWTNRIAAFVSLSAGLAALRLARRPGFRDAPAEEAPPVSPTPVHVAGQAALLVSLAVSGLVGMLLQIVWVRAVTLVVGSLTYSLSGILVAFLLGIGAGSLLHARMSRGDQPPPFGTLLAGVALSGLLLVPFFEFLPGIFLTLVNTWGGSPARMKLIRFLVVLPVVVVPTTLLGYILPAWVGYLARKGHRFGRRFGAVYAWNTAGAVAGAALTGFVFIPSLGAQWTLVAGAVLAALCGTVLSILFGNGRSRIAAGVALVLSVGAFFLPPWDARLLNSGVFYLGRGVRNIAALTTSRFSGILYFREGIGATVAIARFANGSTGLIINGKVDASNRGDMETQVKLAALPMLLHPDPRRVAVIGLGSGVTSGTATLFEEAETIETIEVEPAVAEAARFFGRENRDVLHHPRHRLRIGDARSHFLAPGPAYDVVISEPSNPWLAGESDLFTAEFFRAVRNRLAPGGIFCQWIHGYSISPEAFRVITRTFRSVFPGATLWSSGPLDFLLIGCPEGPLRVDPEAIRMRFGRNPGMRDVSAYFDDSPGDNFAEDLMLGPGGLATFSGEGPLHVDDHPILEFLAADSLYLPPSGESILRKILAAREEGSGPAPPGSSDPVRRWRAGKYHLSRARTLQAAGEFFRSYTLGWKLPAGWKKPCRFPGPSDLPGELPLDLYPSIGAYRPEEREEARAYAVWAGSMDTFLDASGFRKGGVYGGEKVLGISGLAGTSYTSFFLPVPVSPSSEYEVAFGLVPPADPEVSAGCAVMEFDILFPEKGQPSKNMSDLHRLNTVVGARIPGAGDVSRKRYTCRFRTSPATKMVHVHFFRDGKQEEGDALFDGIDVRRIQ